MAEQQPELNNLEEELGYHTIELEFIIQDFEELQPEEKPKEKERYQLSPKISWKEKRKDRKSRQKSWIKIDHNISEFSIAEYRISR